MRLENGFAFSFALFISFFFMAVPATFAAFEPLSARTSRSPTALDSFVSTASDSSDDSADPNDVGGGDDDAD